jgi:anti-anti-sigma factor
MEEPGSIETELRDDVTVVTLVGEYDIFNADAVREQLRTAVESGGGLVVSLVRATFIDSSVVNALFQAHRELLERERQLVLQVATASIVQRVLEVSSLIDTVPSTPSLEDALVLAAPRAETGAA